MNNMVSIKEKTYVLDKNVHNFLNPDYIYIPIEDNFKLTTKTGSDILKEQILLKNDKKNIYSPISGHVLGKTDSLKDNDNKISAIVLENDFKENTKSKKGTVKYINEYSKEDLIKNVSKYNALDFALKDEYKYLLVSGVDIDPFEKTFSYISSVHTSKILETIDALATIYQMDSAIIALSNKDSLNVVNYNNHIGTYPNITMKLVPDNYPMGFKELLVKHCFGRKYKDMDILYLTVEDIFNIYNVLKRRKPITEKFITVAGDALGDSFVINVKIGTALSDIVKNCCKVVKGNYYVVVNGLIAGTTLETLNNIVNRNMRSMFLNTYDTCNEKKCINCGLCNSKCPVGLNPKYLMEHKRADRSKCIHCGICTYICPAKINFKKHLGGNNEK